MEKKASAGQLVRLSSRANVLPKSHIVTECSRPRGPSIVRDLYAQAVDSIHVCILFTSLLSRLMFDSSLSGCGHTYCQSCLHDWFTATLTNHMVAHPTYDVNYRMPPEHELLLLARPGMAHLYRAQWGVPPSPQYSCPTCRTVVTSRPTEDFALKALVRTMANAQRESSPKRTPRPGGGRHVLVNNGPWDGFFPIR